MRPLRRFGPAVGKRPHSRRESRQSAFTLVELLTVCALISILIAILLPALVKARAMARVTVCKDHLRNIGMALHMNAVHYGTALPAAGPSFYSGQCTNVIKFRGRERGLGKLVGRGFLPEEPKIFGCPASKIYSPDNVNKAWRDPDRTVKSAYLYRETDAGMEPKPDAQMGRPLAVVMDNSSTMKHVLAHYDDDSVNILFLDGHVVTASNIGGMFTRRNESSTEAARVWHNADLK